MTNANKCACPGCGGPAQVTGKRPGESPGTAVADVLCYDPACGASHMLEGRTGAGTLLWEKVTLVTKPKGASLL